MLLSRFFSRQNARMTRRTQLGRRPLIEALEGRQLLSTSALIVGNRIGSPMIVGNHIGSPMIVGNHIGTAAIQGNHIGTAAIQGNHIGSPMIVGSHIGVMAVSEAVVPNVGVARKH